MAISTELKEFEELARHVGPSAALKLAAFFGGRTLYVPHKVPDHHILVRLLGREAANYLADGFGGTTISAPACELKALRRAGKVFLATRHNLPAHTIARLIGIGPRQLANIKQQLGLEGFRDLVGDIEVPVHSDEEIPA